LSLAWSLGLLHLICFVVIAKSKSLPLALLFNAVGICNQLWTLN
jgi:hypothetical protein